MDGLTKREIFAAIAMQGILANAFRSNEPVEVEAVKQADKLIAELEKSSNSLSDTEIRDVLQRVYDIYGYAWPDQDQRMVRRVLGIEESQDHR